MARNQFKKLDLSVAGLWIKYKKTNDEGLRNLLMVHYLCLVEYHALRISARLPASVEYDDLAQAGAFGLKDAIGGFDLGRKTTFATYSSPRIRGAILDEVRSLDWVPRLVRSRAAVLKARTHELESKNGHSSTREEVLKSFRVSTKEMQKLRCDSKPVTITSLTRSPFVDENFFGEAPTYADIYEDRKTESPDRKALCDDLREFIIHKLDRISRLVFILVRFEGLTMKETGLVIGLCESRVSQIHKQTMNQLRSRVDLKRLAFAG